MWFYLSVSWEHKVSQNADLIQVHGAKVFCLAGAGPPPNTGAAAFLPTDDHTYYIARVDLWVVFFLI